MGKKKLILKDWSLKYGEQSLAVQVPGDIVGDLMDHGILPDVLFGDNYRQADWVHRRDWIYSAEFELSEEDASRQELLLVFHAIDTYAEITLNGKALGRTDNMFRKFSFDVRDSVRIGKNLLEVKILSIREKESSFRNEKYSACFNDERLFIRKPQCHFGWDWAPNFPGTGIAGEVILSLGERGGIADVRVNSWLDGAVSFTVETTFNNRCPGEEPSAGERITVRAERAPGQGLEQALEVSGEVCGSKNLFNLYVEAPRLWYPNGYGEQPLYAYEAVLEREGRIIDRKRGTFAFRTFEVRENPIGERGRRFDMFVNGIRFRAVGSNWVPASIMTGRIPEERYRRLLTYAREAGINMLRVWGGGLYEKDVFYDLCDRLGIMVWQDFMFACGAVPDDIESFRSEIEREATEQIVRLRNHPSLGIWCGGNELTDSFRCDFAGYGKYIIRVMLPGLCAELDGTRRYVWDSPYALTDVGNDVSTGDCHLNALSRATANGEIENYRRYQWDNENNFDTECAVIGMCRLRSFRKFMPEEKLWPQNSLWEDRLACNPYDDSVVSFTERINLTVDALFGPAGTLPEYIKKSMAAHSEVLRDEIEYYRSLPFNSGVMNWMYNDIWGNATWSLVDYYLEKKPAYYAMKRAGKRRLVGFTLRRDGWYLHAVNDTAEVWSGELSWSHVALSGKTLAEHTQTVQIAPFEQLSLPVAFDSSVKDAVLYARLGENDSIYFYDLWKDKSFTTDLSVEIKAEGCRAEVTVRANAFARMVFLDLPEGVEAELSDNYFDLLPGSVKKVTILADRPITEREITVKTYADDWTE